MERRRREVQAKRFKREREAQEKMQQKQLEELERRAQYAAEVEMKRERSEAVLREREISLQKVGDLDMMSKIPLTACLQLLEQY